MANENKGNSGFTVLIILSVIAILIYVFWDKIKPFIIKPKDVSKPKSVSDSSGTQTEIDTNTILKKGMNNDFVILLQELLNIQLQKNGNSVATIPGSNCNAAYLDDNGMLIPDGDFGSCTEIALLFLTGKNEISINEISKIFGLSVEGSAIYEQVQNESYNPGGLQSFFNWLNLWD